MDDESFNLQTMKYILTSVLKKKGYWNERVRNQIDLARDGQEAVELVHKNIRSQPYGLILSDC